MFRSLIDERGPWSANPFPNSVVKHWKLDKAEDTWRRRPKLKQNYYFDEKLCNPPYAASSNETAQSATESKSGFVGHIPEQMKRFLLKGVHRITDEGSLDPSENDSDKFSVREDPVDSQSTELIKDCTDQDIREPPSNTVDAETTEVFFVRTSNWVGLTQSLTVLPHLASLYELP